MSLVEPFTPDPNYHFPFPTWREHVCVRTALECRFAEKLMLNQECILRMDRALLKSWARITLAVQPHHTWLADLLTTSGGTSLTFDPVNTMYASTFAGPVTPATLGAKFKDGLDALNPLPQAKELLTAYLTDNTPYGPLMKSGLFAHYLRAYLSHTIKDSLHSEDFNGPVLKILLEHAATHYPNDIIVPIEFTQNYSSYRAKTKLPIIHTPPLPAHEGTPLHVDRTFNGISVSRLDSTFIEGEHYIPKNALGNESDLEKWLTNINKRPFSLASHHYQAFLEAITQKNQTHPAEIKQLFCRMFDLKDCHIFTRKDGVPLAITLTLHEEGNEGHPSWHNLYSLRVVLRSFVPLLPPVQSWGALPGQTLDYQINVLNDYVPYYDPAAKSDFILMSLIHKVQVAGGESSFGYPDLTEPELDYCISKLETQIQGGKIDKSALLGTIALPQERTVCKTA